ncbi:MAG: beta-lactamase family protein, partial [Phaeodactylibacter sp.]|nr:beta-lactamase family protein [Phaeodactylibacter sp.]
RPDPFRYEAVESVSLIHSPILNYTSMILKNLWALLALATALSCTSTPKSEEPPQAILRGPIGQKLDAKLSPFVEQLRKEHDCPSSIAIGITQGDSIIYAKAFGYANVEERDTADIYTLYALASISKPVVATAVVKLQEQGKLKLSDPVVKHLPYFRCADSTCQQITLLQLLTHTSGLPKNLRLHDWEHPSYDDDAPEQYVRSAKDTPLEFAPGTDWGYSDVGFNILGDVIAKASGKSFEAYVEEQILRPSGMATATFTKPRELPSNWALPYIHALGTTAWKYYPYNRMYAPCTSLHANLVDMCQWGMTNLHHGSAAGNPVLNADSYDQLFKPWADTPWGQQIGLSWFLQEYEGMKTIMHTGETIGFSTQLILYPEEDICIVVLANRAYSRTARIANAAMEIIKDLPVKPYQVSGRFPFMQSWQAEGLDHAKILWKALLQDTTDNYYAGEWELNLIGHALLFTEDYEEAKAAFDFNMELFPDSPNTYDSYGD